MLKFIIIRSANCNPHYKQEPAWGIQPVPALGFFKVPDLNFVSFSSGSFQALFDIVYFCCFKI